MTARLENGFKDLKSPWIWWRPGCMNPGALNQCDEWHISCSRNIPVSMNIGMQTWYHYCGCSKKLNVLHLHHVGQWVAVWNRNTMDKEYWLIEKCVLWYYGDMYFRISHCPSWRTFQGTQHESNKSKEDSQSNTRWNLWPQEVPWNNKVSMPYIGHFSVISGFTRDQLELVCNSF